jgi:predicted DNA-binding ribbon-helix-helix protein
MKNLIKNIIRERVVKGNINGFTRVMINLLAIYEDHNVMGNIQGIIRVVTGR